jgi:aryl-alcohol dehydrogenase-like predicted oxidoreductase
MYDFDTVLLPVNPAEPSYRSFLHDVVPFARKKGMGIVGMKVYFRGFASGLPGFRTMEPFFRYALSQSISTAVIGCDDVRQLEENAGFASAFSPMTDEEAGLSLQAVRPFARQLMYYKP